MNDNFNDYRDNFANRRNVIEQAAKLAERDLRDRPFEEMNELRADIGEAAVMVGCLDFATGKNGIYLDIKDALSNIAHFCDRTGLDPESVFDAGLHSYRGDFEDGPQVEQDATRYPDTAHA